MTQLCDRDCNHCPMILHPNSRMLTKILNELLAKFGDGVYEIVQRNDPNFTVCYDCLIDDFVHFEGCEFATAATTWTDKAMEGRERGTK